MSLLNKICDNLKEKLEFIKEIKDKFGFIIVLELADCRTFFLIIANGLPAIENGWRNIVMNAINITIGITATDIMDNAMPFNHSDKNSS